MAQVPQSRRDEAGTPAGGVAHGEAAAIRRPACGQRPARKKSVKPSEQACEAFYTLPAPRPLGAGLAQPGARIARCCERADGRAPGRRSRPATDKSFDKPASTPTCDTPETDRVRWVGVNIVAAPKGSGARVQGSGLILNGLRKSASGNWCYRIQGSPPVSSMYG